MRQPERMLDRVTHVTILWNASRTRPVSTGLLRKRFGQLDAVHELRWKGLFIGLRAPDWAPVWALRAPLVRHRSIVFVGETG
jgi:hypothetical protein